MLLRLGERRVTESITSTIVTPPERLRQLDITPTRIRPPTVLQRPIRVKTFPLPTISSPMMCGIDREEIEALQFLGLTTWESKAYLALVKAGPLRASELSFLSNVPRPKLYMTMRLLDGKGLAHVAPSNPETFAAVSPLAALISKAQEISNQAASALGILQKLAEQHELTVNNTHQLELPREANELWHIDGRKYIYRSVDRMLRHAANSICYYATAAGLVRAYKAHAECLEDAAKRGVNVRLLAQTSKGIRWVVREFAAVANTRRTARPLAVNFVCVDGRELVVFENSPGDFDVDSGGDRAAWTTNRLLVEGYESLFDREWEYSSALQ